MVVEVVVTVSPPPLLATAYNRFRLAGRMRMGSLDLIECPLAVFLAAGGHAGQYKLLAFVSYLGRMVLDHSICCAPGAGSWFCFGDASAQELTERQVATRARAAYMLFWGRANTLP